MIENYTVDGTTLIEKGPILNLYRATIDNDGNMGQDLKNIFDTMVDPQVEVMVPTAEETKDKVIMVSLKGCLLYTSDIPPESVFLPQEAQGLDQQLAGVVGVFDDSRA